MTDKDMKHLSRRDLLELLIRLTDDNEQLTSQCESLRLKLDDRVLDLQQAGTIAEAAIRVNGVFEAAQQAADQYLDNLKRLNGGVQAQADRVLQKANQEAEIIRSAAMRQAEIQLQEAREKLDGLKRAAADAQGQAEQILQSANQAAETQLQEAREQCQALSENAQKDVDARWSILESRLNEYCEAHEELRGQLESLIGTKTK